MIGLLTPYHDWFLVGHIVSVMSWMAGMFYLPRIFVYHAERAEVGSELDQVFQVMEHKLLRLIMTPAMIASWGFGLVLLGMGVFDWSQAWSWIKIGSVLLMTGMHGWLAVRRKEFAAGTNTRSGRAYRLANEVPTVLMLIIVIMVIVRPF